MIYALGLLGELNGIMCIKHLLQSRNWFSVDWLSVDIYNDRCSFYRGRRGARCKEASILPAKAGWLVSHHSSLTFLLLFLLPSALTTQLRTDWRKGKPRIQKASSHQGDSWHFAGFLFLPLRQQYRDSCPLLPFLPSRIFFRGSDSPMNDFFKHSDLSQTLKSNAI